LNQSQGIPKKSRVHGRRITAKFREKVEE